MVDEKKLEKLKEIPKCNFTLDADRHIVIECQTAEEVAEITKIASEDGIHIRQVQIKKEIKA